MEEKLLALSKAKDFKALTKVLNEVQEEKLGKIITSRCSETYDDLGLLLKAIFQGSSCNSEDGLRRHRFVFQHCMNILNEKDISSKLCIEIVGTLLVEFDETSSNLLSELIDQFIENIKNDSMKNGRVFQLIPKIFCSLACRDSIPLSSDGGGELSGVQYKSQMINTLCSIKWDSSCVIHLANMFREVPLTNEELKFVIEKIIRMFKSLELEEIPPIVYQLLILCSKGHRLSVLEGITSYFSQLDAKCYENEQVDNGDLQGISKDQLRHTEGNVILHVTFAIKQDQEMGKEFVKYMKTCQQHPHKILTALNLALALSIARIHRFEEPIFDVLKGAVLKSFKSVELRKSSKWMQDNVEEVPDISKEILQTVKNSMYGWDHVTQGIVQLGFILMDTFAAKNSDVSNSTPQQEACRLGSQILLKTFKAHDIIRTEILEQIFNRILTKMTNSPKHFIDLLKNTVSSNPQALLDSLPKVKEAFEYLSYLPVTTANGLLQAVLPLMRISITLRDSFMLVLRKAMFSRNLEARKIAVSGFLIVLKHFKVRGANITSSQPFSQSSQSSSHSSNQVQVDVHRGSNSGSNAGNEALCLEILGGLRRCFTQQADIRMLLYEGLYDVLCKNPKLQRPVVEIVHKHFSKYYESDQDVIPPVKLDPCLTAAGELVYLAEPLSHLLSLLQQYVAQGVTRLQNDDDPNEEDVDELKQLIGNLEGILKSLIERMNKCEMEDFELDKSADYSLNSGVGMKNNIFACLVLGILEVLIEHLFTTGEYSQESGETISQLFNKFLNLSNILKEKTSLQGKRTRQNSTKQFSRSMMSINTTATILKAVFSDSLPSHQQSLETLRSSSDFLHYLLTVTQQKLNQVNENGFCDGVGGENMEHIYKQCTIIGRVLSKLVNGESCLTDVNLLKKDKIINQALYGLYLCINIISNRYQAKIASFLSSIDNCRDSDANVSTMNEDDVIHQHIKRFQRLIVTILTSPSEVLTMKDVPSIINIVSLLSRFLKSPASQLVQVHAWVERICIEHNIDDVAVTKAFLSLLLSLTSECNSSFVIENKMAADIHKQLGDIDEDIEAEDESHFAIINPRTAAPTMLLLLLNQIGEILDEVDWVVSNNKAELSTSLLSSQEDETNACSPVRGSQRETLENAICRRMVFVVHVFHELVQSAIPAGSCSETFLKTFTKFYTTLGLMAKYYLFMYAQKLGHITSAFEKMVKCSGKELSQEVYAFLTYVQTTEHEILYENSKGKDKKIGNSRKVRIMKEMKCIPNLIYAVEQYERYLIQLSKKSKIDLMENFKRSTSRDFRINGATLEAALKEESSEDEKEEDIEKEHGEPQRKKGKP